MASYSKKLAAKSDFKIKEHPTDIQDEISEDEAKAELKQLRKKIAEIQDKMYAHDKYSVLICLQGMDTAGKDSLIREVFKEMNVRGVVVESFKTPTEIELQHDYLWRHEVKLPEKGKFTVFNRTHYENVLVTRVHPEYLLNERIPHINDPKDLPTDFWKMRFDQINNFEKRLTQNGMLIMKFFLNLSKDEQKNRLLRRLDKEDKNWKFSPGDLKERTLWDKYMECYEDAIAHTTKKDAPWYVIPADNKKVARYLVAQVIFEILSEYKDIQYPEMPEEIEEHKKKYKQQLEAE
ncbi:PPK2 family polyphosphate kinase [Sphingobacterium lactis]|uniref:Polyphosphate:nucleotide phosphotransferase, PPK2 family n=1 Tax=Sphingobacterium lactis TaxID=797291 RepID=A0A1H6C4F5_9SPHI|nr:PPK2 family polyphosphate kinase [Sphingobacterium lactis]SEG67587.1 polyphosphate:nucleotide phosphotransferase, PPK2 family [Sphingobacterium lactis]